MKKKLFLCILVAAGSSMAFAEGPALWSSISAEKKITKQWSAAAEVEYRSLPGFDGTDRVSIGLSADYQILPYVKVDAGYIFMNCHSEERWTAKKNFIPAYWYFRHRTFVSATGKMKFGMFTISLRERWQYTYRPEKSVPKFEADGETPKADEVVKGKGINVLRSRLLVEYNIKPIKLSPYASIELYHSGKGLDKTRYTVGIQYKITKKHSVEAYYRYQDHSDEDEMDGNIIGLGYKYKF